MYVTSHIKLCRSLYLEGKYMRTLFKTYLVEHRHRMKENRANLSSSDFCVVDEFANIHTHIIKEVCTPQLQPNLPKVLNGDRLYYYTSLDKLKCINNININLLPRKSPWFEISEKLNFRRYNFLHPVYSVCSAFMTHTHARMFITKRPRQRPTRFVSAHPRSSRKRLTHIQHTYSSNIFPLLIYFK